VTEKQRTSLVVYGEPDAQSHGAIFISVVGAQLALLKHIAVLERDAVPIAHVLPFGGEVVDGL